MSKNASSVSKKFAVLASGAGTTLDFLLAKQNQNVLKHRLILLVTNNPHAGATQVAERYQLKTEIINTGLDAWDQTLLRILQEHELDFIFLIGFLKKVGPATLKYYSGRIYNSHPSLLPKYGGKGMYGSKVAQAILAAGEIETGVTIHHIDGEYDVGKILKQVKVSIKSGDTADTLESRVKEIEKQTILDFINSIG